MTRRYLPFLVATAVFLLVTFGLAPALNFLIRLRARHGNGVRLYGTLAFSGSWVLGLLAAAAVLAGFRLGRRRLRSQSG